MRGGGVRWELYGWGEGHGGDGEMRGWWWVGEGGARGGGYGRRYGMCGEVVVVIVARGVWVGVVGGGGGRGMEWLEVGGVVAFASESCCG